MNNMPFRKYNKQTNKQTALTIGQRCLFVICDLSVQMQAALQTLDPKPFLTILHFYRYVFLFANDKPIK